jgi:putative phosphoesterase
MTTRICVLSDTHIRPGGKRRLPDAAYAELADADLVLHAGDVVTPELLDELSGFAPTRAVLGNNDVGALVGRLPETRLDDVDGVRIAMIHDSGPRAGREGRMRRRFPDADVVVFGHSHIPIDAVGLQGQRLFNPGSPTDKRTQPRFTLGRLVVAGGELVEHAIVDLGPNSV